MVKESDSGIKHTSSIKQSFPCDLAGPREQETLKYNSSSEEEKRKSKKSLSAIQLEAFLVKLIVWLQKPDRIVVGHTKNKTEFFLSGDYKC